MNSSRTAWELRAVGLAAVAALALCATGAGEDALIGSGVAPVFAPDGASVAFSMVSGEKTEIAVAPSAGGAPRVAAEFKGRAEAVRWFPDGKNLLVMENEGHAIWRVPQQGGERKRLAKGEGPRLSPNGETLAYLADDRLYLLEISSGRARTAGPESAAGRRMGDWMDDDSLALLNGEGGLVRIGASSGDQKVLVPHKSMTHCFVAASASPRRRLIAVTSDDMQLADPENPTSIWVFDYEGKQVGKTLSNAAKPQWTTAGTLFFSRRTGILMTEDFQNARSVGKGETWAVSPDGALLVVGRRDADTNGDGMINWLDACRLYRVSIR